MSELSYRRALAIVVFLVVGVGALACVFAPYSEPVPTYLVGAHQLLETGRITEDHSAGYMLFLACCLKLRGLSGIFAGQALLFAAVSVTAFHLLRTLRLSASWCLIGVLPVAFHPVLVLNIKRINDSSLSVLILLYFAAFVLALDRRAQAPSVAWTIGAGAILLASMLLTRPNMASVLPLGILITWRRGRNVRKVLAIWPAAIILGFALTMAANYAVRGRFQLSDPHYLAYALHNGTNPYASETMLRQTKPDSSTFRALSGEGIEDLDSFSREQQTRLLFGLSLQYIRQHPLSYVWLLIVKCINFFRPDYQRVGDSTVASPLVVWTVQTLLAMPVVIWGIVRFKARATVAWHDGLFGVLLLPLYLLPFLLIVAEPRFRLTLDVLLLLDTAFLLGRGVSARRL